jgi:hypothetical protein
MDASGSDYCGKSEEAGHQRHSKVGLIALKRETCCLITDKLPALHFYQLALPAPIPPEGSFDQNAALRGKQVFENNGRCATCHVPQVYTEPGLKLAFCR